ncbi:hypothetical protein B9Z55_018313 [Caenorhabditis nigoni]|nr:hypothetical protein B9Z55_018313 [Caenorhabditis nigoni]
MTTEDFNVLLRSMEGQFQLNLARPWAHESDQGGVQRLIADDAITVKNKNLVDEKTGRINSNSNPEITSLSDTQPKIEITRTNKHLDIYEKNRFLYISHTILKKICSYVHCEGVEDQCIDSFVPFGHCCPVCGTRINFYAVDLNITAAKYEFFLAMKRLENSPEVFGTLEKTAKDSLGAEYEVHTIAIINTHNSTYDEDFHKLAEKEMAKELLKLLSKQLTSFGTIKTFSSRIDRTIKTSSKIVASLIYFTVIVVLVGMYAYQYGDFRLPRATVFTPVIRYKRQEDDVAIEMEGGADEGEEEQEVSEIQSEPEEPAVRREEVEDVEDWRNINPNFALASSADNAGMDFEMTETMKSEEPEVQEEHQDGKEDSVQDKLIGIEEVDSQDAENGQNDPENPVQEVMEDLKDEEKPDDTEFGDINPNFESESELDIDSVSPELQNLSESESSSTTDAKSDDVANHKTDDGSSDENTDLLDF